MFVAVCCREYILFAVVRSCLLSPAACFMCWLLSVGVRCCSLLFSIVC